VRRQDHVELLKRSAELQAQGLAVVPQVACRPLLANACERDVAELLQHPAVMLGVSGAGGKQAPQLCDACFPTHLLGHWVRERGALALEQAVWLLSSRSAEVLGIEDRGRLALGLAADVAIFDPARVGCAPPRRARDLPAGIERLVSDPLGIRAVVVNGELIREGDRDLFPDPSAELPGRLLRGGAA
jgi:N-acyl-D-aspartate/D-glutamate deacylase